MLVITRGYIPLNPPSNPMENPIKPPFSYGFPIILWFVITRPGLRFLSGTPRMQTPQVALWLRRWHGQLAVGLVQRVSRSAERPCLADFQTNPSGHGLLQYVVTRLLLLILQWWQFNDGSMSFLTILNEKIHENPIFGWALAFGQGSQRRRYGWFGSKKWC